MKRLAPLLALCMLTGCMSLNMNREPERWITVRDADTGTAVPGISLVYMRIKKPYWIVGAVMRSREYVAGPDGRAYVPSGVILRPSGSDYVVAFDKAFDLESCFSQLSLHHG